MSKSKEKDLAFSLIWWILKRKGGRSDWSSLRLESFRLAQEILTKHDVDVINLLDKILDDFPRDRDSGDVILGSTLEEPELPDKIAKDIAKKVKTATMPPSDMIEAAKKYYNIRDKMLNVDEYLAKWNNDHSSVLHELEFSGTKDFVKRHENAPAAFEFIVAKAFCTLFEIPLFVEYNAPVKPRKQSCIIWRGTLENYSPKMHAPGGASDIIVYAREYYALIEATLRYTKRQWKEEIEPIFRHTEEFAEILNLDRGQVYLIFVTPQEVLRGTYKWIHSRAEEFNVLSLSVENLTKLVRASLFINGLPHAEIRRTLQNLHTRSIEDIIAENYLQHINDEINDWCEDVLRPYLDLFLATKAYEIVIQNNRFCEVGKMIDYLSKDHEVRDYMSLGGIAKPAQISKVLDDRRRSIVRYLSLFGLAKQIDGYLAALSPEEFETRFLKMFNYIRSIGATEES